MRSRSQRGRAAPALPATAALLLPCGVKPLGKRRAGVCDGVSTDGLLLETRCDCRRPSCTPAPAIARPASTQGGGGRGERSAVTRRLRLRRRGARGRTRAERRAPPPPYPAPPAPDLAGSLPKASPLIPGNIPSGPSPAATPPPPNTARGSSATSSLDFPPPFPHCRRSNKGRGPGGTMGAGRRRGRPHPSWAVLVRYVGWGPTLGSSHCRCPEKSHQTVGHENRLVGAPLLRGPDGCTIVMTCGTARRHESPPLYWARRPPPLLPALAPRPSPSPRRPPPASPPAPLPQHRRRRWGGAGTPYG